MTSRHLALSLYLICLLFPKTAAAGGPPHVGPTEDDPPVIAAPVPAEEPSPPPPEPPPPEPPPPTERSAEVKLGRQADIGLASTEYRSSGQAPVVYRHGEVIWPFGESVPRVKCTPLRVCDIELEEGEIVRDVALGDTERWIAKPLMSGKLASSVPHIVVKPKDWDLETNLVIGTTHRTYHLDLESVRKSDDPTRLPSDRHSFYFPEEIVESWTREETLRQLEAERPPAPAHVQQLSAFEVDDLNFDYAVEPGRKVTWAPHTVFDDGEHVYIQLPSSVRSQDLPALLVEIEGGGLAVSNYRVQGLWYIVDGLFEKAELVVGVGKHRRKVAIRSLRPKTGA